MMKKVLKIKINNCILPMKHLGKLKLKLSLSEEVMGTTQRSRVKQLYDNSK